MAKIDEVKEFIGFLKAIFITLIAIETSLISYIFTSFEKLANWKLILINAIILIIAIVIMVIFFKIIKEIKKLKDL